MAAKIFLLQLPAALIIALVIRTYCLQAFWAATDAAAPELPRGSHFLVWKPAHYFTPGDLIAYRHDGWVSVGRVDHTDGGSISVKRNGEVPILVARAAILGKVISVYWRAPYVAPPAPPAAAETWQPGLAPGEKPDLNKISNEIKTLMEQTNYEASLQHQLWYFNHSLENGVDANVRQTFGMMDWTELVREYPKARQALIEIRDQDQEKFRAGQNYSNWANETTNSLPAMLQGDMRSRFNLFQEMSAINLTLNDEAGRQALVKMLVTTDPQLAWHMGYKTHDDAFDEFSKKAGNAGPRDDLGNGQAAFDAIHKNWEGLRKSQVHVSHVMEAAQKHIAEENARLGMPPPVMPADSHNAADDIFMGDTRQLIKTLLAHGHQADAEKIQDQALAVLDDPWLKSAVTDAETELKNQSGSSGNP